MISVHGIPRQFPIAILIGSVLVLAACAVPWGTPQPTSRNIPIGAICGTWQVNSLVVELKTDMSYVSTTFDGIQSSGRWFIGGGREVHLQESESNDTHDVIGYVIDLPNGGFGLFGGTSSDPDSWSILKRVD